MGNKIELLEIGSAQGAIRTVAQQLPGRQNGQPVLANPKATTHSHS